MKLNQNQKDHTSNNRLMSPTKCDALLQIVPRTDHPEEKKIKARSVRGTFCGVFR
jgi:hypothetical protein